VTGLGSGESEAVVVSLAGSGVGSVLVAWLALGGSLGGVGVGLLSDVAGELLGDVGAELLGGAEAVLLGDVGAELLGGAEVELLGGGEDGLLGGAEAALLGDVDDEAPDAGPLPSAGVPVGDGVGVAPDGTGGALPRIAMMSALNASSRSETSESELAVICLPNWVSWFQTSPRARSCSFLGDSSTDSTSWLAIAAVMQR
jgi:hypothetical protein